MSLESSCPGCGTKVRIPETLLGKKVKCPKCSNIFTAEEPNVGFEEVEEEAAPPRRRRPAPVEDDGGDDRYEEEDYDRRPRRRRGGGSRRAAEEVKAPAVALLIVGGLGLAYALVNAIYVVAMGGNPAFNMQANNIGNPKAIVGVAVVLNIIWGVIVPYAGFMMLTLRNYASVMIGVIFAMLPCNAGCLLGLPFGIWALTVLSRPHVKNAFSS
jgi:predicted Zn finger-like uncharacterized protein